MKEKDKECIECFDNNFKENLIDYYEGTNDYKYTKKAIVKIDPSNPMLIFHYPSIKEAARILTIRRGGDYKEIAHNISKCIRGQRDHAYGYIWRYVIEY